MERSTIHLLAKRGKSQRQIAEELGISRVTVARALREPIGRQPAKRRRDSVVDHYEEQIRQWLEEGLTAVRMLELARADSERPYLGGRSVFCDHVRRLRRERDLAAADVPIRFEGLAGEYLQVDWGEVRGFPFCHQPPARRYFLSCRLKYSRASFVRWTADMTQETLLRGLVECFVAFGFVPWVLVFDNMKTVTSGRDEQGRAVWNQSFLQFAREFDFHPEACSPGAANQKGSTESLVKWVKGNFLSGRSFADDADLAGQNEEWLEMANTRPNSATGVAPVQLLQEERRAGGRLPACAYDYGLADCGWVNAESLVAVEGNTYSVPVGHVGASVVVRLHRQRLAIWRDGQCLAEHPRVAKGSHKRVRQAQHYGPILARKRRARLMMEREELLELGGVASAYLATLSRRRRQELADQIATVYCLYQEHGTQALLEAMARAQGSRVWDADYLKHLLSSNGGKDTLEGLDLPAQSQVDRELRHYEAWVVLAPRLASPEEVSG
jgi:transposase